MNGAETMENPQKRQRSPDEQVMVIMVPARAVSGLIGKKGETIQQIEGQCHVMVSFAKLDEYIVGQDSLRRCVVKGARDALLAALQMIMGLLHQAGAMPDPSAAKITFLVPDAQVSNLIGKQGCNVKQIEESTGAKVSFARPGEMPEAPGDRPLTIGGADQHIVSGFAAVLDLLASFVATGLMEPPSAQQSHQSHQAPWQQSAAQQQWSGGGGGGYSSQPAVHAWAGAGGGGGGYSAQPKVVQHHYQAAPQQYSQHAAWGQPHVSPAPHGSPGLPHIEMMLLVPDSHAGMLIGPKGANLKACQDAVRPDQIFISFAKPEDNQVCPETNGQLRPVTLRGPIQACTMVQGLLLEKLQRFNHDGVRMVCSSTVVIGGAPKEAEAPMEQSPQIQGALTMEAQGGQML